MHELGVDLQHDVYSDITAVIENQLAAINHLECSISASIKKKMQQVKCIRGKCE